MDKPAGIHEKMIEPVLIAGIRTTGRYEDMGLVLKKLAKSVGPLIDGNAMCLYYDDGFKADNADYEACFPVRKIKDVEGVFIREIPGGKCLSAIHVGPYESLRDTYAAMGLQIEAMNLKTIRPSREIYLKGPGMFLKGNPQKYRTEIQFFIDTA